MGKRPGLASALRGGRLVLVKVIAPSQ
jgi:hypothetical protein